MASLTHSSSPIPLPLSHQIEIPPNVYKYKSIMKIILLIIASLSLLAVGWSNRLNIPVGLTTHKSLKAMETFFPETRPPPPRPASSLRKKRDEIISRKARAEWVRLKALHGFNKEEVENEEVIVEREEESVEDIEDQVVEQEDGEVVGVMEEEVRAEAEERESGEVEDRFYSQLELTDMEASKRGLLNWVMQMDFSGQTFFDG
jgi:hypothetical protein